MRKIRNSESLERTGDIESRRIVLSIAEQTLEQLDAYERIKQIAHVDGGTLAIGARSWDLSSKRHVYLIGAGKACNHMARAFDEILGDWLTRGIAIVKIAEDVDRFNRTEAYVGGHPIPTEAGYEATAKILELVNGAGPDDLFIGVVSGGSSALMNCPVEGVSLRDEMEATDVLLKSGAGIRDINAVRRHISRTNGGRLAQRIAAVGAELICLGISDGIGNPPTSDIGIPCSSYSATPFGPDPTTLEQARQVIADYDIADRLPASVVEYLTSATAQDETPKAFPQNTYFLLNTVPDSIRCAQRATESLGLPAVVLTTSLEGESRDVGAALASIAREVQRTSNPAPAPCVLLAAGETFTRIAAGQPVAGTGGPGHELAAGFAIAAARVPGAACLSIDTEGTDGTTLAAGALCDSTTLERARRSNVDLMAALRQHSTFEALDAIGDAVITGNTGTNLCDLNIIFVPCARPDGHGPEGRS